MFEICCIIFVMAKEKEKKAPPPEPSETEIEDQSLDLSSASLEEQARERLKPDTLRKLKKIAYYTAKVGLPLDEACMLVDVDFEKFQEEMKLEPLIGKIIRVKELEFKKDMLHTLTAKARSGDDKLAQWLLEKKFPDEYGPKKGGGGGGDNQDIIFEAIRFIRKNGDNAALVSESSSRAISLSGDPREPKKALVERIDDILGNAAPMKVEAIDVTHAHE